MCHLLIENNASVFVLGVCKVRNVQTEMGKLSITDKSGFQSGQSYSYYPELTHLIIFQYFVNDL